MAAERVRFGPREDQDIPATWASKMLTLLYQRHRSTFASLLQKVVRNELELDDETPEGGDSGDRGAVRQLREGRPGG